MNAIGPLWDGNEVWLVTFGGALFAAFPEAYATAFSGFLHGLHAAPRGVDFQGGIDGAAVQGGEPPVAPILGFAFFGGSSVATLCCSGWRWETRFWACRWTQWGTLPAASVTN